MSDTTTLRARLASWEAYLRASDPSVADVLREAIAALAPAAIDTPEQAIAAIEELRREWTNPHGDVYVDNPAAAPAPENDLLDQIAEALGVVEGGDRTDLLAAARLAGQALSRVESHAVQSALDEHVRKTQHPSDKSDASIVPGGALEMVVHRILHEFIARPCIREASGDDYFCRALDFARLIVDAIRARPALSDETLRRAFALGMAEACDHPLADHWVDVAWERARAVLARQQESR